PLPPSLHAHLLLLDQSGRALVRHAHREATATRHPSQHASPGGRHPALLGAPQRGFDALCVGQVSRRDPRQHRSLLSANFGSRTLAYYVQWHLEQSWAPLLFKDDEPAPAADP